MNVDEKSTQLLEAIMSQIRILTAEHEAIISVMPKEQQNKIMAELAAICRRRGIERL